MQNKKNNTGFTYQLTVPTLLFLLVMTVYPVIFTLCYSFTDYNYLKGTHPFSGLANYKALFQNLYFRQAVRNTVVFTVLAAGLEVGLGLLMALFVKSLKRGQKVIRTLLLLPYLLPAVTVALIWRMMLSPNYGIVTELFANLGLPVYNWFYDVKTAFGMLLLIDVWQNVPFAFLLIYAHLQGVPESQYQAASIDGAGALQRFWYITLPNIGNGIALCTMLRIIDTFRLFEKVNILTGGGPANTTTTITQFMYMYGVKTLKFGFASACAVVMTVFVLIMSSVYIRKAMK